MWWIWVVLGGVQQSTPLLSCSNISGHLLVPNGTVEIPERQYQDCPNITGVTFNTDGYLEKIGNFSFLSYLIDSQLTGAIVIPKSVKEIGNNAFAETKITSLKFESNSSLESIGYGAFIGATNLSGKITIPASVKRIGSVAFGRTAISRLEFEPGCQIELILANLFRDCTDLTGTIEIPPNVKRIENFAFSNTGITGLQFASSNTLTFIMKGAFKNSNKLTGHIGTPDTVTSIGQEAFKSTSIKSIIIPEKTRALDTGVFDECTSLDRVLVPGSESWCSDTSAGASTAKGWTCEKKFNQEPYACGLD